MILGPRPKPSIGAILILYFIAIQGTNVLIGIISYTRNVNSETGRLFPLIIIVIFLICLTGPIIGFLIWFVHDLLRRSRQPRFPRRRALRLIEVVFVSYIIYVSMVGNDRASSLALLATGSIYARLRYPRSPWPRILRIYGFRWWGLIVAGPFFLFFIGATLELPHTTVMSASLCIPLLWVGWEVRKVTPVHPGRKLRLPNRCVLLLRPFGFDDESFVEIRRNLLSILDSNPGAPFDVFACSSIERQLATFVTFGDPGDIALRRGARRYYVADTSWQAVFEELIPRIIAFVAVAETISEGFAWELARLRQLDLHTRLFLFTAPSRKPRKKSILLAAYERVGQVFLPSQQMRNAEDSWKHVTHNCESIGYRLKEYPGPGAVIGFTEDGTALVLARNCKEPNEFILPVRKMVYGNVGLI